MDIETCHKVKRDGTNTMIMRLETTSEVDVVLRQKRSRSFETMSETDGEDRVIRGEQAGKNSSNF
jgi:hypothetical protein